jgi:hypothetical protein
LHIVDQRFDQPRLELAAREQRWALDRLLKFILRHRPD